MFHAGFLRVLMPTFHNIRVSCTSVCVLLLQTVYMFRCLFSSSDVQNCRRCCCCCCRRRCRLCRKIVSVLLRVVGVSMCAFYLRHIHNMWFVKFDYGYNMKVSASVCTSEPCNGGIARFWRKGCWIFLHGTFDGTASFLLTRETENDAGP